VVVNFNERTVSCLGYVARINEVDTADVSFGGKQIVGGRDTGFSVGIIGDIDRVTGHMTATTTTTGPTNRIPAMRWHYDVLCKVKAKR
jgi:hypothetical protein